MKGDKLHHTSFEQQLRQAADRFKMEPSEGLWQRVQQNLPEARKPVLWWRWAAAAAVLLLAGLGGWYLLSPKSSEAPGLVSNTPGVHQPAAPAAAGSSSAASNYAHPADSAGMAGPSSMAASQSISGMAEGAVAHAQPLTAAQTDASPPSERRQQPQAPSETNTLSGSYSVTETPAGESGRKLPLLGGAAEMDLPETTPGTAPDMQYSAAITRLLLQQAGSPALLALNSAESKEGAKLTVGLFFTPGVSYRTLKTGTTPSPAMNSAPVQNFTNGQLVSQDVVMRVNAREKPMQQKQGWGWGSGLRLALHLPENWILQTGLSLRQTNYEVTAYQQNPAYVTSEGAIAELPAPVTNSSYARYAAGYGQPQRPTTLENRYLSTELPLLVGKRFGHPDAFSFTVLAGAGLTYLLQSNSVMYAPASQRYFYDKSYLSPFNSSLILEASMHIPLSRNLGFSIGPALQYQMFSSYKDYSAVKEYPYLIGLKTAFLLK